ncbi:LytTR family DNA-binding domain-containing protein [Polaribacter sp. PL03]|uniref:LytR/AlgR family response regulator transcription factor n=1 Tax=Polaribacter sp. PL03 TaxID=3088353 RepID=UPI0029D0E76C|nr:LytTR family DNA-binding domain-containing protein [Polaribacter sp. PL03]MDX6745786.1 LytTR family DNA-binding domain-containing protein [Polaribacter sp. PL03]
MNCIIIDDDASARLIIRQLCKNTELVIKEEFSSAIEAIKYLNSNSIDVAFLDIHMPTFSGFDFIKTLKTPLKVILTTSDKNFALEAFEFNCVVDYLLKPIGIERFQKSIDKLSSLSSVNLLVENEEVENKDFIFVNIDKRLVKINIPEILLIEARGDYISIRTDQKSYVVHSTLKKIDKKLPSDLFLRIHRSYIINTTEIIDIEDNSVLIKKHVIPISRSHKTELIKRLNLL